jgi:hypothetical protein
MTDVPDADHRLLDTNFWGVVNGSRIAAEHLRHRGGALIAHVRPALARQGAHDVAMNSRRCGVHARER